MRQNLAAAAVVITIAACSPSQIQIGSRDQIPPNYQLQSGGSLIVGRVEIYTEGKKGSPYTMLPLEVTFSKKFQPKGSVGEEIANSIIGLVLLPVEIVLQRDEPTVWHYWDDGLMAVFLDQGEYDLLSAGYPQEASPPPFINPGLSVLFEPLQVPDGKVLYIGNLEIRQEYSLLGALFHRVDVSLTVHDRYEETAAEFRARYPQFRETPVERKVLRILAPGQSSTSEENARAACSAARSRSPTTASAALRRRAAEPVNESETPRRRN